jgi:hypothetical protein
MYSLLIAEFFAACVVFAIAAIAYNDFDRDETGNT